MVALREDPHEAGTPCEDFYGPYPSSIPVPFLGNLRNQDKQGDTPSPSMVLMAQSHRDMPIDIRDVGTPDDWIAREGRLVRLTGKHPLNAEPPLKLLHQHNFLTPASMHFVRSHGTVPKLTWQDHRLKVGGNHEVVEQQPRSFTMDDLAAMPSHELPVTMVCAGTRRKEQNMIKQTNGFHYGPCGVSNNVWKGVLLRDLLLAVGIIEDESRRRNNGSKWHVEFLGAEDLPNKVGQGPFPQEPWGPLVKFGTSIPLVKAMDPALDILVAYEANGERLHPDHGAPVRLIIPGYVAGRSIKWLAEINVIDHETYNHWHYHDNRILPPNITAESDPVGDWWYNPNYIILETMLNSVVAKPDHGETICATKNPMKMYTIEGFAYTGGGRPVTRVEISLDDGHTWLETTIDRKEKPTAYGKYWCWIWWKLEVKIIDLMQAKEIICRAWDSAHIPQPMNPTWNLLGHGTNCCFRVKIVSDHKNKKKLVFEHPTQPGHQSGGWMTRSTDLPPSAGFGKLIPKPEQEAEREEASIADESLTEESEAVEPVSQLSSRTGSIISFKALFRRSSYTKSHTITGKQVPVESSSSSEELEASNGKRGSWRRWSSLLRRMNLSISLSENESVTQSASSDGFVEEVEELPAPKKKTSKRFTLAEIRQHNKPGDTWIIIKGRVYDCSRYMAIHPGGQDSILINAGIDCSMEFFAIHSPWALRLLKKYYIGRVDPESMKDDAADFEDLIDEGGNKLALDTRGKYL